MTQCLIKYAQGMAQVIHGVNKLKKISLYNFPLSIQIFVINLFISLVGFIFLIFFNFYLIQKDENILKKNINAN